MACRLVKSPFLAHLTKRHLAAQASAVKKPDVSGTAAEPQQSGVSSKGLVVHTLNSPSPVAAISLIINCGARNETYENVGVSHALRTFSGLSTKNRSHFLLTRQLQQIGAQLTVTTERECTIYTLKVAPSQAALGMVYFADSVSGFEFREWELEDNRKRMKYDLDCRHPAIISLELCHKAAFRNGGLGNPIYCPENRIGKYKKKTLLDFVSKHFNHKNAALVGSGVTHKSLLSLAETIELNSGPLVKAPPSPFFGHGDMHECANGKNTYVSVATAVPGYNADLKQTLVFYVLQHILGTKPPIIHGRSAAKLSAAVGAAVGDAPHAVQTLYNCYADTSLFGASVAVPAGCASAATEAAVKLLRTAKVTDDDVAIGKKKVGSDFSMWLEGVDFRNEMACSSLFMGDAGLDGPEMFNIINSISASDVNAALTKLANAKFSIGAYGNLSNIVYADQL